MRRLVTCNFLALYTDSKLFSEMVVVESGHERNLQANMQNSFVLHPYIVLFMFASMHQAHPNHLCMGKKCLQYKVVQTNY